MGSAVKSYFQQVAAAHDAPGVTRAEATLLGYKPERGANLAFGDEASMARGAS